MSARDEDKILNLIAASGLSLNSIRDGLARLRRISADEVTDRVAELRRAISKLSLDHPYLHDLDLRDSRLRKNIRTLEEIDRLLRGDSGLTARNAADMLTKELSMLGFYAAPMPSKKSFLDWVERLLSETDPGAVLHAAHRIARQRRDDTSDDIGWRLRDPDDPSGK